MPNHVIPFLEDPASVAPATNSITWRAAPLARLQRVPEAFRQQVRTGIEAYARDHGAEVIERDIAEAAFVAVREKMCPVEHDKDKG